MLAAVLALALIGYDRLAGAGALVWTALRLPALWDHHAGLVNLAPEVLPIVCFCVLVLAPRRRAPDPRRLAWLLVPATLVAAAGPPPGEASPLLVAGVLLAALLVVVAAVALLPTDPRLAIAGAVSLSNLGIAVVVINHDGSLVCTPVRRRRPVRPRRRGHPHAPVASRHAPLAARRALPTPNLSLGIG